MENSNCYTTRTRRVQEVHHETPKGILRENPGITSKKSIISMLLATSAGII